MESSVRAHYTVIIDNGKVSQVTCVVGSKIYLVALNIVRCGPIHLSIEGAQLSADFRWNARFSSLACVLCRSDYMRMSCKITGRFESLH